MSDTQPVNRFVDLEARVDDSDQEEGDSEDSDTRDFLDDGPTLEAHLTPRPWRRFANVDENPKDSSWDDVVATLEERYTSEGSGLTHSITKDVTKKQLLGPEITTAIDNIIRLPTDDCPFWRIRCKLGLEKEIVSFLLRTTAPRYQIRFAFSHWLAEGWVYVQTSPNRHLYELLRTTPGVIHNRCGLVIQFIPSSEYLELLRMPPSTEPQVGKWVQVLKGTYKGDVGHVLSTASCGVELLLVPRLSLPYQLGSKRKRSTMALFDDEKREFHYKTNEPDRIEENFCSFGGNRFQHGLLVRQYSRDSVSTSVSSIPLKSFNFFRFSGHPELIASNLKYPRPSEWLFAESDEVFIVDTSVQPYSFKVGVISALRTDSAELDTEEGTVSVPWLKLCKVIHGGNFVEVMGGEHQGWTGLVVEVDMSYLVASIIPTGDENMSLNCSETFEVHVNLLKPTTAPHTLGTCPHPSVAIVRSDRVPWINAEIIIAGRHAEKTRLAIVKDVLGNQPTPSGLRVVVQMKDLESTTPFRQLVLDYDSVLEASHAIKLYDYAPTKNAFFVPRNRIAAREPLKLPTVLSGQQPCSSGSATPIPESPFLSSPAWNPSSRTPQPNPDHSLASRSSSPSLDRVSPSPQHNPHSLASPSTSTNSDPLDERHILLDSRLLNAQLRVVVTGGTFNQKELVASVQCLDERLSIQRRFYKSSKALLPNWVTPKSPNPTRDNGLLVVIKGEHCGKYVRRIHHRYVGEEAIVILSVVRRVAGHVDVLTGEQLELDVSYLCVCEESKEDKTRNRLLMDELREEACKIRAK